MYHCYQTQNAQHQHTCTCKKKNHVIYRFHYPLPPMREIKISKSLQINGNFHFHKNTSKHSKQNIPIFKIFKRK
jgi:hypothetical protein